MIKVIFFIFFSLCGIKVFSQNIHLVIYYKSWINELKSLENSNFDTISNGKYFKYDSIVTCFPESKQVIYWQEDSLGNKVGLTLIYIENKSLLVIEEYDKKDLRYYHLYIPKGKNKLECISGSEKSKKVMKVILNFKRKKKKRLQIMPAVEFLD